jgi:hypothetical protein
MAEMIEEERCRPTRFFSSIYLMRFSLSDTDKMVISKFYRNFALSVLDICVDFQNLIEAPA